MNESIEIKLDEADEQAMMTEDCLSHEEIFSYVQKMKTFDEMLELRKNNKYGSWSILG